MSAPTIPYESTEAPEHLAAHLRRVAGRDYCAVNEGFWILHDAADRLDKLLQRAKDAENALLSFTPGGSEYFLRDGPNAFRVDVKECERIIREQRMSGIEAKKECARLRKSQQSNGSPQANGEKE